MDKLNKSLKKSPKRPSWDEYFLSVMERVASRATCDRGRNAAIAVKDNRILATGYVGSPAGLPHCDEAGHMLRDVLTPDGRRSKHCVRTIHAEQNVICQAAKFGISLNGATIYTKMEPCFTCAKMLVNVGIKRIVCQKRYHAGEDTRNLLKEAGVKLEVLSNKIEKYEEQK